MIDSLLSCSCLGFAATAAGASTAVGEMSSVGTTIMIFIFIVFGLAVLIGLVFLQIFLSKAQSKWPGLVLPGCSIFLSVIAVLGFLLYSIDVSRVFLSLIAIFLVFNVPTLLYLTIYKVVRSNRKETPKNNQEINKMNIQDLE